MLKQWALVIVFAGVFIALFSLPYVSSAQNISVSYNYTAIAEINFSFSLELVNFSTDTYDIKIDITNSSGGRISRIYDNGTWRSTSFYVVKAINLSEYNSGNFSLNITENYTGVANITIKTRNNRTGDIATFIGYFLNVTPKTETQNNFSQNTTQATQTQAGTNNTAQTSIQQEELETIGLILPEMVNVSEIFNVTIKMFNLKNKPYDLKVELTIKGTLVSEVYNERDKEWQSSFYYLLNFTESNGNIVKNVTMRLKSKLKETGGSAKISAKLRKGGVQTTSKTNNIQINFNSTNKEEIEAMPGISESSENYSKQTKIYLNKKEEAQDIKSIPYKSFEEFVREYAVYAFAAVCIFLIIILKDERENTGENNN